MTTHEIEARRYSRRCRRARKIRRQRRIALITIVCCVVFVWLCTCKEDKPTIPTVAAETPMPTVTTVAEPTPVTAAPPVSRTRDDIVSEGRLLSYDLQETMQDCCEEYGLSLIHI